MKEAKSNPVVLKQKDSINLSWRDRRYNRFYEVVDHLVDEIQAHVWAKTGKPMRRVNGDSLEKLHYSVECLVRDCMAVVLQRKRKGEAAIKKGQHHYSSNRSDLKLTYNIHIKRAFDGLLELGYLEVTKGGHYDRTGRKDGTPTSRLTRYVASENLLRLFTESEIEVIPAIVAPYKNPDLIRIRTKEKDENGVDRKRSLAVKETPETLQMRKNLITINNALSKHWYDLDIPDDEFTALQERLADDPENERSIRLDQRSLYRVFNDPDLRTGGRFYGGWWQNIPREYRRYMVVSGKQMVELDYSNQHPSILYAQAGKSRPEDCYSNVIRLNYLPKGTTRKDLRDMVKAAFNAMLNSLQPLKHAPDRVQPSKFGLKWADVSEAIMAFHEPIAHHFYTGVGLRLQRMDSDIAEKILLHFSKSGIAILPLHDSFLMHNGYESWLEPVMRDVFEEVVGVPPKIDSKAASRWTDSEQVHEGGGIRSRSPKDSKYAFVTSDIEELLASRNGSDRRLDAFFSL